MKPSEFTETMEFLLTSYNKPTNHFNDDVLATWYSQFSDLPDGIFKKIINETIRQETFSNKLPTLSAVLQNSMKYIKKKTYCYQIAQPKSCSAKNSEYVKYSRKIVEYSLKHNKDRKILFDMMCDIDYLYPGLGWWEAASAVQKTTENLLLNIQ